MRKASILYAAVAVLTLGTLIGCGTTPSGGSSGGTNNPPPGGATTGDTSGYEGRLAWSAWALLDVPAFRLWDLPSSAHTASRDASSSTLQNLPDAALSPDGTRAAYTLIENTAIDDSYDEHVVLIDAANGSTVAEANVTPPSPNVEVYTRRASIADNGTVALELHSATFDPGTGSVTGTSDTDVALWTVGSGEPAAIPGAADPAEDRCPRITADGSTVYFVSDRDGPRDFYRVAAAGGAVERLPFADDPAITEVLDGLFGCPFQLSDDGGTLAFMGKTSAGDRAFVMDTASGAVSQIGTGASGQLRSGGLALSADGTHAAFVTSETLSGATDVRYRLYGQLLDGSAPATVIATNLFSDLNRFDIVDASATSLALSADGSEVAYVGLDPTADQGFYGLFVRGFDGSDPRLVTNDPDAIMLGLLDITF